jgi:hypothetical protein
MTWFIDMATAQEENLGSQTHTTVLSSMIEPCMHDITTKVVVIVVSGGFSVLQPYQPQGGGRFQLCSKGLVP